MGMSWIRAHGERQKERRINRRINRRTSEPHRRDTNTTERGEIQNFDKINRHGVTRGGRRKEAEQFYIL